MTNLSPHADVDFCLLAHHVCEAPADPLSSGSNTSPPHAEPYVLSIGSTHLDGGDGVLHILGPIHVRVQDTQDVLKLGRDDQGLRAAPATNRGESPFPYTTRITVARVHSPSCRARPPRHSQAMPTWGKRREPLRSSLGAWEKRPSTNGRGPAVAHSNLTPGAAEVISCHCVDAPADRALPPQPLTNVGVSHSAVRFWHRGVLPSCSRAGTEGGRG
jgi:hypothetical protein